MFAIEKVLSQVQSNGSTFSGENLGTLKESLKSFHQVSFSNKNLFTTDKVVDSITGKERLKNVVVNVYDSTKPDEAPHQITCSVRVSGLVRKAVAAGKTQKAVLSMVISLPITKNSNGIVSISAKGNAGEKFGLDVLAGEEQPVTFEELLVL